MFKAQTTHQNEDKPIVTAGAVIPTQHGEVLGTFHQYAYTGKGISIYSSLQLEGFKNDVNDKSIKVNGDLQCIHTAYIYAIPLNIKRGLAYLAI